MVVLIAARIRFLRQRGRLDTTGGFMQLDLSLDEACFLREHQRRVLGEFTALIEAEGAGR